MAKRLTKALREKRRWIGITVSGVSERKELKDLIAELAPTENWKLYDFNGNNAIIRIFLKDQPLWRPILDADGGQIRSITTSGKIRLVRERLDLK
tara:strand:- start:928 stop:1212 length:285 start_codon:yes stop_codon:yes gene_type:complete